MRCSRPSFRYEFEEADIRLPLDGHAWLRRSCAVHRGDAGHDNDTGKTMKMAAKRKMSPVLSWD